MTLYHFGAQTSTRTKSSPDSSASKIVSALGLDHVYESIGAESWMNVNG